MAGGNRREKFSRKPSPGEISAKDGQKPGEIGAKVRSFTLLSTSFSDSYELIYNCYPFHYPFYPLLKKEPVAAGSPPLVARYARLKPLNRSVPLRSTSLAALNAAPQPIRPALRADKP
jgi:hypothetical protein